MKLYNTLTRQLDTFKPIDGKTVRMYSCGPTVYDHPSIGNWTAYIRWDLLARVLRGAGYEVQWYMNITDVGHLVSDEDTGEDKLEKGAKREGITAWDVANKYTKEFLIGLDSLNLSIDRGNLVRATDNIKEQIEMIKTLEEKGHTYLIEDGVYFDSTTFPDYGEMARLDIEGLRAGVRVSVGQKRHPTDFALWKLSPKDEQRDMEWESPWGKGFPGWHIECSAMAIKYLGETLDIHTGGIDHIPIHHTNEIAQSESFTGKKFANFWIHSNFMQVEGHKMSKSLGNIFTLNDLVRKGYDPLVFKLHTLQSHFQTESNFTFESLEASKKRYQELRALSAMRFQSNNSGSMISAILEDSRHKIRASLEANLNSPQALAQLSMLVSDIGTVPINTKEVSALSTFIAWLDSTLGLGLEEVTDITNEQKTLISQRQSARNSKNWGESDKLRDELLTMGIGLNDTPEGVIWYLV